MNKLLTFIFIGAMVLLVAISFFNSNDEDMHISEGSETQFEGWETDLNVCLQKSKESQKNILMLFTGSDWCPPCKRLEKKVFRSEIFKEYAKNNLELIVVDFPRHKRISDEQLSYNESLADKFRVDGYPTIVFLNLNEKEIARMGYMGDSPEEFIQRYERKTKSGK